MFWDGKTRQPFEGIHGREIEPEFVFTSEFSWRTLAANHFPRSMPDQGCDNSRSSHSLSLAVQYLLVYRLILSPCILTTVLAGLQCILPVFFQIWSQKRRHHPSCKKMKRATRHFPCSSQRSVVSLSESRGGLKFHGVISAKRYRLVSLNGKHNFNRKQTRLYTEL